MNRIYARPKSNELCSKAQTDAAPWRMQPGNLMQAVRIQGSTRYQTPLLLPVLPRILHACDTKQAAQFVLE